MLLVIRGVCVRANVIDDLPSCLVIGVELCVYFRSSSLKKGPDSGLSCSVVLILLIEPCLHHNCLRSRRHRPMLKSSF